MPPCIIGNYGMRHSMLAQFPCGQASSLITRSGFVYPNVHWDAGIMSSINGSSGRTMVHKSQPTGIAMGQHVHGGSPLEFGYIPKKIKAVLADGSTGRDVFVGNLYSSGANSRYLTGDIRNTGSNFQLAIHRPRQVYGRRTSTTKDFRQSVESRREIGSCGSFACCQPHAVTGGRSNATGTANPHIPYSYSHLLDCPQVGGLETKRKATLVNNPHDIIPDLGNPNRTKRFSID